VRYGIDTGFLVAVELAEHPEHGSTRARLGELIAAGDRLSLAPQVLAEFLHVVTDARRFERPLEMDEALRLAGQWWTAREVDQVFPSDAATHQFLAWMERHSLGRKRVLDTMLAATYQGAGIHSLLTLNARDFRVFGGFSFLTP
jgi:predicted nucleic acid-binding protein